VELGRERLKTKLEHNKIHGDYNDRWALDKVEAVIGKASFIAFDEKLCDKLSKAYPIRDDGWSKRDKVKKQIIKMYNSLPSDVRGE